MYCCPCDFSDSISFTPKNTGNIFWKVFDLIFETYSIFYFKVKKLTYLTTKM